EVGLREGEMDEGRSKAFVPQSALERIHVPLEQGGRLAELPPAVQRHAQKGRRDRLCRAIAESTRKAQGLLPESDAIVPLADTQALIQPEGGDPCESVRVAERPGEHLRLLEGLPHPHKIKGLERVPDVEVDVDGQLSSLPGLREMADCPECLLQVS